MSFLKKIITSIFLFAALQLSIASSSLEESIQLELNSAMRRSVNFLVERQQESGKWLNSNGITALGIIALAAIHDDLGQEKALEKAIKVIREQQPPISEARRRLFTDETPGTPAIPEPNDKIATMATTIAKSIDDWLRNPDFTAAEFEEQIGDFIQSPEFTLMDLKQAERFAYLFVGTLRKKITPIGVGIPEQHFQQRVIWLLENQKADGEWKNDTEELTIAYTTIYTLLAAIMQNPPLPELAPENLN